MTIYEDFPSSDFGMEPESLIDEFRLVQWNMDSCNFTTNLFITCISQKNLFIKKFNIFELAVKVEDKKKVKG